jgi:ABC-type branched-subunit amino acid transport system substrate-binding protein
LERSKKGGETVKKILFISVAVVLVLSVGLIGCGGENLPPPAPESIKVGLARDLDGPLAVFECGYGGIVYRWFADKVNADGGILLSDYAEKVPIELVVRDFDVLTWDLADVTEALIDTDKVDFVWGGPGTDCIFTQAPICNREAKVLITLEGGASTMIWDGDIDGWPYVWVTLSFANWYQIPVLHDMLEDEVDGDPTAYITYIGEAGATHGIEYKTETITQFGADNVIDGGFHSYWLPDHPGEPEAIIAAAKAAYDAEPYDVFCAYTYPWNVAMLTLALMASDFNPPAIVFGPGGNSNDYFTNFGPFTGGVCSFIVADENTSTTVADVYDELAASAEEDWDDPNLGCDPGSMTSGWETLDFWGMPCYVAGLEMWAAAVEEAGNLDSSEVRDALAGFEDDPAETILGDCWFTVFGNGNGGGILAYECHPGEIGQWINGKYKVVGGSQTSASFVYPNTGNWFWLLD